MTPTDKSMMVEALMDMAFALEIAARDYHCAPDKYLQQELIDARAALRAAIEQYGREQYARLTDLNSELTDKANQYLIENARLDRELAAETARWEEAVRLTWQMVDPLKPAGEPGSYWRGQDAGIVAALTTLRANLKRHNVI